jgi:hypothetical protein
VKKKVEIAGLLLNAAKIYDKHQDDKLTHERLLFYSNGYDPLLPPLTPLKIASDLSEWKVALFLLTEMKEYSECKNTVDQELNNDKKKGVIKIY